MNKQKTLAFLSALLMLMSVGCSNTNNTSIKETETTSSVVEDSIKESDSDMAPYEGMTAAEITATLTLEEKAYQMQIPAIYSCDAKQMKKTNYGSILSTFGLVTQTPNAWKGIITNYQKSALEANSPIPFLYGQDSVHGVNYAVNTVIFPHNINIGAANDPELTYKMGLAVADEMKMTRMIWNYAPCVAVSSDPRWGRTYESYSSDPEIVKSLGGQFTQGQIDGGVIVCTKHYIGDGSVVYGTGEVKDGTDRLIDRGNAILTKEEIDAQLAIYKDQIERGAQSIMISHSALNGMKMHENKEYITDVLRGELGFEGVVVSDWESIQNIDGAATLKEQVIISINAGIDWLMEPMDFKEVCKYIVEAVNEGSISQERIDEAVTRIIQLKMDAGLFDDPYLENLTIKQSEAGSDEYRQLARKLVEKSMVLIRNEGETLPLKAGTSVFVTGPAANDTGVQCGGWTRQWNGLTDAENKGKKVIENGTTILDGLEALAAEYDLTIITDEAQAADADVVLLCVGEQPYAEWNGDTADLSITGALALEGNKNAIEFADSLDLPTVALIVAGRNVIIDEYEDDWESIVMCGLPGSEGDGVANVLTGKSAFEGKLAMPWYESTKDIDAKNPWLQVGYGLTY
ncbi:MAG: glycoside hydrolase family 3 protein [Ruminococcus sp.]|nr:glycoside hydrolase family 3 protein [Ruminococcus sp.]